MRKFQLLIAALVLSTTSALATIVDGERQKPTYQTQGFTAGQEGYLYNVGSGLFWTNGNAWGTQASVGTNGLLVRFNSLSNGVYTLEDYYNNRWYYAFFDSETQIYVDRNNQSDYFWEVENNGSTFRLMGGGNNYNIHYDIYPGMYVGLNVAENAGNTAISPLLFPGTGHYVDWAFVPKESYESLSEQLALYNKAQDLKVILDQIEDLGGSAPIQKAVYLDESSTMTQLETAIEGAKVIYVQVRIETATDKDNVDVTMILKNPAFEEGENGWTVEAYSGSGHAGREGNVRPGGSATNQCYEAWNNRAFDIYQTVSDMPVGVYEIEVQGFYRYGRGDNAWNAYQNQSVDYVKPEGVPVYVYMNNNATNFVNVFGDPRQITNASFYSASSDYSYHTKGATTYYFPNGMASAAIAFSADMYTQSAFGLIAKEGDVLRLGVKGASNQAGDSWVIWDNFKLIYRGFKPEVIQPVLEAEMATIQSTYLNLLMGKSQYAAITTALADAETAIANQDGEAMFNALNDLYDAKDPALASKDLFLAEEVPASLQSLRDAIASMEGQKLSAATLAAANTLVDNISGNKVYEDSGIAQLKQDVNSMITRLNNSVAYYNQLNTANGNLEAALVQKTNQALHDEAATLLAESQAAYENGTLTDEAVSAKITELNEKITALNSSATNYSNLNEAIGRLQTAINEVANADKHVSQAQLDIANAQLTSATTGYANGTIADDRIESRITAIDNIIANLTRSIELYRQFDAAIAELETTLAQDKKVAAAVLSSATILLNDSKTASEEGSVADDNIQAQIVLIEDAIAAYEASATSYEDFAAAIATLETAVAQKTSAATQEAGNTLLTQSQTDYTDATLDDTEITTRIAEIETAVSDLNDSAVLYAQFSEAIGRLQAAIDEVADADKHVSQAQLDIANAQLTSATTGYANGTIADNRIEQRITAIDNIITNLTRSIELYRQFDAAIAELETTLAQNKKVAAAVLSSSTTLLNDSKTASEEGSIADDNIQAQIVLIEDAIAAYEASATSYEDFAAAIATLETAVAQKTSAATQEAGNSLLTQSQTDYTDATLDDTEITTRIAEIETAVNDLNASAVLYAQLSEAIVRLQTAINEVADADKHVSQAQLDIANAQLTSATTGYANGTIADDRIEQRITAIDNIISNLTHSYELYQQFAAAIEEFRQTVNDTEDNLSNSMKEIAQLQLGLAEAQYNDGTIGDDQIETRITELQAMGNNLKGAAQVQPLIASATTNVNSSYNELGNGQAALSDDRDLMDNSYILADKRAELETEYSNVENGYVTALENIDGKLLRIQEIQQQLDAIVLTADNTALFDAMKSELNSLPTQAQQTVSQQLTAHLYLTQHIQEAINQSTNTVVLVAEYATFCTTVNLDFSQTDDVKAYVVRELDGGEQLIHMERVKNVPAGTGIMLVGTPGEYTLPTGTDESVGTNLLVGTTSPRVMAKVEGDYTNYILASGSNGIGFYAVKDGTTLPAGKAYLPIPSALLSGGVKDWGFQFSGDATYVRHLPTADGADDGFYYTLSGQRITEPKVGGIYIKNGKKVLIK